MAKIDQLAIEGEEQAITTYELLIEHEQVKGTWRKIKYHLSRGKHRLLPS